MIPANLIIHETADPSDNIKREVIDGLSQVSKRLPCHLLYDERGAFLFQQICETPEYYLTRVELEILRTHGSDIAKHIAECDLVLEPGAGSMKKAEVLLRHLRRPITYAPIDVSSRQLEAEATRLALENPDIFVRAIGANFHNFLGWRSLLSDFRHALLFFPGSTIGNFEPNDAIRFLKQSSELLGKRGMILVGVDLKKDPNILNDAYNDSDKLTEKFEKNVLVRLNRELGASFSLNEFEYEGFYNSAAGRVEMYLVSRSDQTVSVAGRELALAKSERIHLENSYKYTVPEFQDLISKAGLTPRAVWTDLRAFFSIHLIEL